MQVQRWLFILALVATLAIGHAAPVTELPWSFKPLSKHFSKGMNRLGIAAGDLTAEVLLEIEF